MFLPVLLVRDFGMWGFVVFALPNVVGAAGMGWVLSRDGMAERLVARHRPMMLAFSAVTIAFHGYLLGWLASLAVPMLVGVSALLLTMGVWDAWGRRSTLARVGETVLFSAVAAGLFFAIAQGWTGPSSRDLATSPAPDLLWLAPACVLGFALCPYLDLTFLTARAALPAREARLAFTLGFGVVFFAAIVFTLGYAGYAQGRLESGEVLIGVGSMALAMHLIAQTVFTVFAHANAADGTMPGVITPGDPKARRSMHAPALGLMLLAAPIGYGAAHLPVSVGEMTAAEVGYRLFLSFYGLVFPAYVWLVMIPTRDGHAGLGGAMGRRKGLITALAIGLAAPFYWMGFIALREPYLIAGVTIVMLARVALPRRG